MLVSADDVASTLRLLIPGFVALSVFYWFGLAVRRTDWQWTLWSLIVSVPIGWLAAWIPQLVGYKLQPLADRFATCGISGLEGVTRIADRPGILSACALSSLATHDAELQFAIALAIAVIGAAVAILIWRRVVISDPAVMRGTQPMVWGSYLRESRWLLVKTADALYNGWTKSVANPVETDDLDLLLGDPKVVFADGTYHEMPQVEGLLLKREDIKWIALLESGCK